MLQEPLNVCGILGRSVLVKDKNLVNRHHWYGIVAQPVFGNSHSKSNIFVLGIELIVLLYLTQMNSCISLEIVCIEKISNVQQNYNLGHNMRIIVVLQIYVRSCWQTKRKRWQLP